MRRETLVAVTERYFQSMRWLALIEIVRIWNLLRQGQDHLPLRSSVNANIVSDTLSHAQCRRVRQGVAVRFILRSPNLAYDCVTFHAGQPSAIN